MTLWCQAQASGHVVNRERGLYHTTAVGRSGCRVVGQSAGQAVGQSADQAVGWSGGRAVRQLGGLPV